MWRYLNRHSLAFSQSRADAEPSHLAIAPAALPDDGSRACRAVADQASRQARRPCSHVDPPPADGAGRPPPPFPRMGCPSLVAGVRMDQDEEEFRHDPAREDAALRRGPPSVDGFYNSAERRIRT